MTCDAGVSPADPGCDGSGSLEATGQRGVGLGPWQSRFVVASGRRHQITAGIMGRIDRARRQGPWRDGAPGRLGLMRNLFRAVALRNLLCLLCKPMNGQQTSVRRVRSGGGKTLLEITGVHWLVCVRGQMK